MGTTQCCDSDPTQQKHIEATHQKDSHPKGSQNNDQNSVSRSSYRPSYQQPYIITTNYNKNPQLQYEQYFSSVNSYADSRNSPNIRQYQDSRNSPNLRKHQDYRISIHKTQTLHPLLEPQSPSTQKIYMAVHEFSHDVEVSNDKKMTEFKSDSVIEGNNPFQGMIAKKKLDKGFYKALQSHREILQVKVVSSPEFQEIEGKVFLISADGNTDFQGDEEGQQGQERDGAGDDGLSRFRVGFARQISSGNYGNRVEQQSRFNKKGDRKYELTYPTDDTDLMMQLQNQSHLWEIYYDNTEFFTFCLRTNNNKEEVAISTLPDKKIHLYYSLDGLYILRNKEIIRFEGNIYLALRVQTDSQDRKSQIHCKLFIPGSEQPVIQKTFTEDREQISVGRADDCDIRIQSPFIRQQHCRICHENSRWILTDNVCDDNIQGLETKLMVLDEPVQLRDQMHIYFNDTVFEVNYSVKE